jgi:LysR family transcriptional regulator, nod-box dependent transcriptional activator
VGLGLASPRRLRKVSGTVATFVLLPRLIVSTQYIGTIHTRMARSVARTLPLKVLKPQIDFPVVREMLQWHRNRERDPANLWLRSFLIETAAKI